jgi:hypothetical protein
MQCEVCGLSVVIWAHDARIAGHSWTEKEERDCACLPIAICLKCEIDHVRTDGFLLMGRPHIMRAVANGSQMMH